MLTFIHVNKCGGKSIDAALVKLLGRKAYREIHGLVGTPVTEKTQGKLVLFVRDPIDRAISSYHYYRMRKRRYGEDLNEIIDTMRNNRGFAKKELSKNTHLDYSLSKYISPSVMEKLELFFVGTTENIKDDYLKLLDKLEMPREPLGHLNMTIRFGKELTEDNLNFLKELYKDDYACLEILRDRGFLTKEYIEGIENKTKYIY